MRKHLVRLLVLMLALQASASALAQTHVNGHYSEGQILGQVEVADGSVRGLNVFAILAAATHVSGHFSAEQILNQVLYEDGSGNRGLAVYLAGGGVGSLQGAYNGGAIISTNVLKGPVQIRDGGDGVDSLQFLSQANGVVGLISSGGAPTFTGSLTLLGTETLRVDGAQTSDGGIAFGTGALSSLASGDRDIAIGVNALNACDTCNDSIAIGNTALLLSTFGSNIGIGFEALQHCTTCNNNIALGPDALYSLTTTSGNIAIGQGAGDKLTTGINNTYLGTEAAFFAKTAEYGVYVGYEAGQWLNDGVGNTGVGSGALYGPDSDEINGTGAYNTALGFHAGFPDATKVLTSGNNNTFLGANTGFGSATQRTNVTAIGYGAEVNADNTVVIGNTSVVNTRTAGVLNSGGDIKIGDYDGSTTYQLLIGETGKGIVFYPDGNLFYPVHVDTYDWGRADIPWNDIFLGGRLQISPSGSGVVGSLGYASTTLDMTVTTPTQGNASIAGRHVAVQASDAIDGLSTHAAADGGSVVLATGDGVNGGVNGVVKVTDGGSNYRDLEVAQLKPNGVTMVSYTDGYYCRAAGASLWLGSTGIVRMTSTADGAGGTQKSSMGYLADGVTGFGTTSSADGTGQIAASLYTIAGITASTTQTQGNGALTAMVNDVSVVANDSDTVTLPVATAGRICYVFNDDSAQVLQIFPASGDDLGAGVNTATTLAAGDKAQFIAIDATTWKELP